jgi:hypothetical protein
MDRPQFLRCRRSMKALAAAGIVALILCGSALAKFQISLGANDTTPAIGQRVTITVRSERKLDYNLRLIAVAPGKNIFRVVATITGDTSRPDPNVARNGFEVPLVRIAPNHWRGGYALPEHRPLARGCSELGASRCCHSRWRRQAHARRSLASCVRRHSRTLTHPSLIYYDPMPGRVIRCGWRACPGCGSWRAL